MNKEDKSSSGIAVLIPAHDEAEHIAAVVRGAKRFVSRVLVVDDGSLDATASTAAAAGAEVIRHPINRGKGVALRRGFEALLSSGAEGVIVLDGDGQHDPEEIPAFIEMARGTGADIVVGNRMGATSSMPLVRYYTNRVMSWVLSRLSGQDIPDSQCGYRLLSRRVLEKLSLTTGNYDTESEMLVQASRRGFTIRSTPVKAIYTGQTSKIRPGRDTVRFLMLILRILIFPAGKKNRKME